MVESTGSRAFAQRMMKRLPDSVHEDLADTQKEALAFSAAAARAEEWTSSHGLDFRYSVPWFGGRYYLRLIAGRERRPLSRVSSETSNGIARSVFHILLIGIAASLFYTLLLGGILLFSAVLQ